MSGAAAVGRPKVAALQMVSGPELAPNLDTAARLVAQAAAAGAQLAALPENFYCIGRTDRDKLAFREPDGDGPVQRFLSAIARNSGVWVLAGTVPIAASDAERVRGACLLYDDQGRRVARCDKTRLFKFERGAEKYDEARTVEAGSGALAVDSPFGRLALSVCYDVRFPELYRALGRFDVMFVPSAFTVPTGAAHWETLLRARAIENQAYVLAPAQGGTHAGGRRTWGHTMAVDPWGEVLGVHPEGEGMVLADIDLDRIREIRRSFN